MSDEEIFARSWFRRLRAFAEIKSRVISRLIPKDDLHQIGLMAALALFRQWREAGKGEPQSALVYAAAGRRMVDHIRSFGHVRSRFHSNLQFLALDAVLERNTPSFDRRPEETLIRRLDSETALAFASPKQREILRLIIDGLTLDEIAVRFGITDGRVAQMKKNALERIRRQLKPMNIEKLKHAIATREGFFVNGTVPARLNNPGDLVFAHQPGAAAHEIHGRDGKVRTYAEFQNADLGWAALERQIRLDASRGLTLKEFIWKYAPGSDGNDPTSYLGFVMSAIGITDSSIRLATVIVSD